jgi:hypothetical protein
VNLYGPDSNSYLCFSLFSQLTLASVLPFMVASFWSSSQRQRRRRLALASMVAAYQDGVGRGQVSVTRANSLRFFGSGKVTRSYVKMSFSVGAEIFVLSFGASFIFAAGPSYYLN